MLEADIGGRWLRCSWNQIGVIRRVRRVLLFFFGVPAVLIFAVGL